MGKKDPKPLRGVFERPKGSGIWWINFYVNGVQRREKVGRRSDAIDLYRVRKADARRGVKLPELKKPTVITFGELMLNAEKWAKTHLRTHTDYSCEVRVLTDPFGCRPAQRAPKQAPAGIENVSLSPLL